jgi:hypothetical protein
LAPARNQRLTPQTGAKALQAKGLSLYEMVNLPDLQGRGSQEADPVRIQE